MLKKEAPQLGLGTIRLGRSWGLHSDADIPTESESSHFLEFAYKDADIRVFDTAPSYGNGVSERRLGNWLKGKRSRRRGITIVTKFGENWDSASQTTYTDFTLKGLRTSIDASIERLESTPDILLLHKSNPKVLRGEEGELEQALEYARSKGITRFGASVTDLESAHLVVSDPRFTAIQFFFNQNGQEFRPIVARIIQERPDMLVMTNRPFEMGNTISGATSEADKKKQMVNAYQFVIDALKPLGRRGIVLTGTATVAHLRENRRAFDETVRRIRR